MLRLLLLLLLHFSPTHSISSGLRRHGRVDKIFTSHAAAAAAAAAAASSTSLSVASSTKTQSSQHQHLKVLPVAVQLTPQTGVSAMNPQTAKADAALPAKYTQHSVPLMDDAFDSTETMKRVRGWIQIVLDLCFDSLPCF